jgi:hypothetical protein
MITPTAASVLVVLIVFLTTAMTFGAHAAAPAAVEALAGAVVSLDVVPRTRPFVNATAVFTPFHSIPVISITVDASHPCRHKCL